MSYEERAEFARHELGMSRSESQEWAEWSLVQEDVARAAERELERRYYDELEREHYAAMEADVRHGLLGDLASTLGQFLAQRVLA
jgi:hypothetical protein